MRDWADGFEAARYEPWGWFRIPIKKESTDVIVWGGSDAGHLYFDEGELADESARKKWKQKINRVKIPRVPPRRR